MILSINRLLALGACDPYEPDSWGQAFRDLFGADVWEGEWTPAHQAMFLASSGRRWWSWLLEHVPDFPAYSMAGWNLRGVDLAGANLTRADLFRANLAGADLVGADLAGAQIGDLESEDLRWRGAIL